MVRLMITGPQLGPVSITFTIIISLTDRRWRPACLVTAYNSHNYNNKTHRLLSLPTHNSVQPVSSSATRGNSLLGILQRDVVKCNSRSMLSVPNLRTTLGGHIERRVEVCLTRDWLEGGVGGGRQGEPGAEISVGQV